MRAMILGLSLLAVTCRSEGLHEFLKAFDKTPGPGVAVAVRRADKILFQGAYGHGLTTETRFDLASVSKQMTAMVLMILKDRKQLAFDDAITKYLPKLGAFAESVTIRMLLQHGGGLPDYMSLCHLGKPVRNADVVDFVAAKKTLGFPPGSKYEYSNTGYALLASIAEAASGVRFPDFARTEIFEKLKMAGTFVNDEPVAKGEKITHSFTPWPFFELALGPDVRDCNSVYGDGSIYSSAADLMRWHGGFESLVTPATLAEAFTPKFGYGFGWAIAEIGGRKMYHHSGAWAEYYNYTARFPDDKTAFVILSNTSGVPLEAIVAKIAEAYLTPKTAAAFRSEGNTPRDY